jgi:hypothetical protein
MARAINKRANADGEGPSQACVFGGERGRERGEGEEPQRGREEITKKRVLKMFPLPWTNSCKNEYLQNLTALTHTQQPTPRTAEHANDFLFLLA